MKLLNLTSRYFLQLIFAMLLLWCAVFYFSIQSTIYNEIDEYLTFREQEIIQKIKKDKALLNTSTADDRDFYIQEITQKIYDKERIKNPKGFFQDFNKYIPYEGEEEPFRRKQSVLKDREQYYQITTLTNMMNSEDILYTILLDVLVFSLLFFALVMVLNRFILNRLWKPFYHTIGNIKRYRLDKEVQLSYNSSSITEFKELNESIEELIKNNLTAYQNQKHFIENASHEMQTPVGIIHSKIELLIEEPNINKAQAVLIEEISEQIHRLSRLNKTLLLLSKIENNQFPDSSVIQAITVIKKCCDYFKDLLEFKNLSLQWQQQEEMTLTMNEGLAEVLFSNLLKNAIHHNIESGHINISITKKEISISNTGKPLTFDSSLLFERFQKKSDDPQSNGLGLAIVKKICVLYQFDISYSFFNDQHTITIIC
ncbi:MAG: HAMP domain-containing histidine kinase [Cytophagaceae bacterium]|nr:HAMP domain-containing histidine kinase [Cytophagaceae bacterium]